MDDAASSVFMPAARARGGFANAEDAFNDFAALSKGRPSDYSGLTLDRLRGSGGIQWPCNDEHPEGTERLYSDGRFWTDADACQ